MADTQETESEQQSALNVEDYWQGGVIDGVFCEDPEDSVQFYGATHLLGSDWSAAHRAPEAAIAVEGEISRSWLALTRLADALQSSSTDYRWA